MAERHIRIRKNMGVLVCLLGLCFATIWFMCGREVCGGEKQIKSDFAEQAERHIWMCNGEQEAQIGKGSLGDVTVLPTLVINDRQCKGKLDKVDVLKAICAGFEKTTEPPIRFGEACGALSKQVSSNAIGWSVIGEIILGLGGATGIICYAVYKYKLRRDMESEIREILAQYMPLDKEGGFPNQVQLEEVRYKGGKEQKKWI